MNRILLFSDTHGRIPLMLRLAMEVQRLGGEAIEGILVAGDLGVWPRDDRLDQATRRFARQDPSELGFQAFDPLPGAGVEATDPRILDRDAAVQRRRERRIIDAARAELDCPVVFIGGNHEDYDYLAACADAVTAADLIPVEASGRIRWLPAGRAVDLGGVRLAGLSGIDAEECGRSPHRYHPAIAIDDDRALAVLEELDGESIDVFLTHDGLPDAVRPGQGSSKLAAVLELLSPRFHVFGHFHGAVEPFRYRGRYPGFHASRTLGVHVNKLGFGRDGTLRPHAVGLLERSVDGALEVSFIDSLAASRIRGDTWHHL